MSDGQQTKETLRHQCAVQVFDGVPCDFDEHKEMGCACCVPYIHSDLTMDHEPGCTACKVIFETTNE